MQSGGGVAVSAGVSSGGRGRGVGLGGRRRSSPQKEALRGEFGGLYADPGNFDETYSILETVRSLALRLYVPGASRVGGPVLLGPDVV